ncbi:hypothetical protein BDN72DRAFT_522542 [Pluteus cervinus]|uniref:Uncharacterized protein n=1 Tax=Pluteus cervinus TaxID=181527 RepID=A0ACD3AZH6_9AGAR|nr:hypothetical protein BDN72DRAFT_522542 [Pluteus cervinus]
MDPTNKPHPQLSIELYRNIVELISPSDKATLASLCVVCHNFYLESARLLYHTIYLEDSSCNRHNLFLQTMVTSPRCVKLGITTCSSRDHGQRRYACFCIYFLLPL